MTHAEIKAWLQQRDPAELQTLWGRADAVRRAQVGDAVHLRGLIELSNYCTRLCGYCGVRAANQQLTRYRMPADEIVACARTALQQGFGTVVLQAGEDATLTGPWVAELIRRIKAETALAVTLSLGERPEAELAAWRAAGADRYLLRFETSNAALFAEIHPPHPVRSRDRVGQLRELRRLGYEVGSGVMIGIPGQSYDDLAADIALFRELDLDMIGVGPFVAHPDTPLGRGLGPQALPAGVQVPNDTLTTYQVLALARLACPRANIPATTALATLGGADGQTLALQRGANVIMPNVTPTAYRRLYQIYPDKACFYDGQEATAAVLRERLAAIGRTVGTGRGDAPNLQGRVCAADAATKGELV